MPRGDIGILQSEQVRLNIYIYPNIREMIKKGT